MKNYEINSETFCLISDGISTKVVEKDRSFVVNNSANSIMENSCEYFGSTLEGRKKGTTNLTGLTHKVPIIVEESGSIIFFPTKSSRINDCCWISLNNLKNYYKSNDSIVLEFYDNQKIILKEVSFGIINNQILRASRLDAVLRTRKLKK